MASTYPTSLDNFTNPTVSDYLNSTTVPHATQHSDLNDAVENLQAKVGIDSSADTDSIDYKVADAASRITTLEAGATANAVVAYADLSARTAANPSPSEGDVSWQEDTNRFDIYNGSAWAQVAVDSGGTYSPSHTNITVGNGTEVARYVQLNKLIFVSYQLTWGSTTSFGGAISVGLPAAANGVAFGSATLTDAGTSNFTALVQVEPTGSVAIVRTDSISGSYVRWDNSVTGTAPFTWTTSDVLKLSLVYEAA